MKDKDRIKEILQMVDKYNYCLPSEIDHFAEELSRIEPQTAVMPTDREIDKRSQQYHNIRGGYHPDFGNGALWLKSQVKVVDLREELISYVDFYVDHVRRTGRASYSFRKCVDEYLASKTNQINKKKLDPNLCTVCHQNYVDSANGYDTCESCLRNI